MNERPILFSAPMVLALLAGTKTQTRRIMKPQPREHHWFGLPGYEHRLYPNPVVGGFAARSVHSHHIPGKERAVDCGEWISCPYGAPGDRLWVRETWRPEIAHSHGMDACDCADVTTTYAAGGERRYTPGSRIPNEWLMPVAAKRGNVPGIHMPRWASRLSLEVTGVRVERLREISEVDAKAEGVGFHVGGPVHAYRVLWNSINGAGSWAANPWVWVVELERVKS